VSDMGDPLLCFEFEFDRTPVPFSKLVPYGIFVCSESNKHLAEYGDRLDRMTAEAEAASR